MTVQPHLTPVRDNFGLILSKAEKNFMALLIVHLRTVALTAQNAALATLQDDMIRLTQNATA